MDVLSLMTAHQDVMVCKTGTNISAGVPRQHSSVFFIFFTVCKPTNQSILYVTLNHIKYTEAINVRRLTCCVSRAAQDHHAPH